VRNRKRIHHSPLCKINKTAAGDRQFLLSVLTGVRESHKTRTPFGRQPAAFADRSAWEEFL